MKLAFSTNAFVRFGVVEAIETIASIGYDGVELMFDAPHLWPATTTPETLATVRAALDRTGLAISNVNAFMMKTIGDPRQPYWHPSWIEPDPEYREIRIGHTIASLHQAAALGAPSISTEPGGPLMADEAERRQQGQISADQATSPDSQAVRSAAEGLFLAGLSRAAAVAEQTGVMLLVEPEPELLLETADQFENFIRRVSSPAVALNYDVGHQYCVGEDPAASLKQLFRYVRHIHLEDIAATRVHAHLVPGDGAIDIPHVLRTANRLGYDGFVTIELYPYVDDPAGAARRAFEFVRPILNSL